MGASTGNMLVDNERALQAIFEHSPLPIVTHCENSQLIAENAKRIQEAYGKDPDVIHHAEIRNADVCYESTALAVKLARESGRDCMWHTCRPHANWNCSPTTIR